MQYRNYLIVNARDTGGKAGFGCNKTTTIQVLSPQGSFDRIVKQFRYPVDKSGARAIAIEKAKAWVDAKMV